MKRTVNLFVLAALILGMMLVAPVNSPASSLLLSQTGGDYPVGYGKDWSGMTAALNSAASVTVTSDFSNLSQMLTYDAIWLDQRGTTGALTPQEVSNISAFIATGRRAVFIGENNTWTSWDNQILGIVGGSFAGHYGGNAPILPAVSNALTAGISAVQPYTPGLAAGAGTSLFTESFATLWGASQNVLVILDVNIWDDHNNGWANSDDAQFGRNVAAWIAQPVPIPGALWLLAPGLAGIAAIRRRFKK